MRFNKTFIALFIALFLPSFASGQDFFSTQKPVDVFNIGVRVGVNTSNSNIGKDVFNLWNVNSWGTGFDAGVVVDLNIKDYFSIQPGLFFESRSTRYAYSDVYVDENDELSSFNQFGKTISYNFNIPILASVKFNITGNLKWSVDFGPYFNIRLGDLGGDEVLYPVVTEHGVDYNKAKYKPFDFGFKMGTGLRIRKHYYIGVHYMAGALGVWKKNSNVNLGGRNKGWVFSAGYDF